MKFWYAVHCTGDQTQLRLKISSNFILWFAHHYGSQTPGMKPEVWSYTTSEQVFYTQKTSTDWWILPCQFVGRGRGKRRKRFLSICCFFVILNHYISYFYRLISYIYNFITFLKKKNILFFIMKFFTQNCTIYIVFILCVQEVATHFI